MQPDLLTVPAVPPLKRSPMRYHPHFYKVVSLREASVEFDQCDNPERAREYWHTIIAADPHHNADVESLYVLHLNTRMRVTGHHLVAQGIVDSVLSHPREIFRAAIVANSSSILLMHNHPSGDPTPSEADIKITRDIMRAGDTLKLLVLDHVILGHVSAAHPKGYASLRELNYFWS